MNRNKLFLLFTFSISLFLGACTGSSPFLYSGITSSKTCTKQGGYWYNEKCWRNYEDASIDKADIDKLVEKQIELAQNTMITIGQQSYPLKMMMPIPQGKSYIFLTMFEDEKGTITIYQTVNKKELDRKGKAVSNALFIRGNLLELSDEDLTEERIKAISIGQGDLNIQFQGADFEKIKVFGNYTEIGSSAIKSLNYTTTEDFGSMGNSKMEVKGNEVYINGDLGTRSYYQLKSILQEHPNLKTVVLGNISGSVNDAVNMHTGRILREAGLNTKVLSDSKIASGAVDLFCAGVERIVEKGAQLGIHSWCCIGDLTAIEIPKEHPAHQHQIEYFTMCMGSRNGPAFYFHTLEAAPFDGVHWMTEQEMKKWKVATYFLE